MTGQVSFVSSGPGDPELLTLKALDRLQRADVILFDNLSSGAILDHARPGAELINVGKRAGRPSANQKDVNRLLIERARENAHVVRLKSGDCGIFGRLEEEIMALRSEGITYEIIPGVSSASAAAAAAHIPLTRRMTGRRLQFVTGADITGRLPEGLNWAALADPEATTAVYMGQRTFPAFARALVAHGLPAETPALLAVAIGHREQRLQRSSIKELAERLEADGPDDMPGLILYGPLSQSDNL